ncbi:Predicted phosphohydrolase or phosphomutase, AlkP superfamily [Halopenitus malekzadehii]|uniref:Predicted phosphohydrolase or phosphomutase, AlkP superfamily n=1 Tax=Halopenitus malekzadehii TaxID=1267564 RepID=A0A1H6II03_9EURY|nr:alkaline phosphatase family protein [Halopenitus malekzadehii]SEH46538.1 Predicted phosphohydrolase or phosphomutase, AlkP superfamily [Halopenitus malekzadehii]
MGLFDKLRGGSDDRVVFLGIDGVPYELITDHPDVFENLHAIAEEGTSGRIESIVPPESSACWPSLTTGQNPGKTGVYGFQDRERGSYDTYVPMGSHVEATRLWDLVTEDGRDATVLNVPVTFPPSSRIQRQVSGFLSPSIEKAASDDEVRQTLERYDYAIDADAKLGHDEDKTAFIENAHETLEGRRKVFEHYIEADDWDLFFGVFMTPDRVNHFLFGDYATDGEYAAEFLEFYRELDAAIGAIRDRLDDDTELVVASDHGFTREEYEVDINRWLEEAGWLSYAADADDPDGLEDIADDARAYSLIPGRLFLNLEGREPRGSVAEADYEDVRDELIADLESLAAPDGRAVCDRIVKGEDAFSGDHTDIAPDLVVIPTDGFDLKAGFGTDKEVFSEGPRNGMHKFGNASLFTTDADVAVGDDVNLFDVAPTILDQLDVDADRSAFDGESLRAD